MAAVRLAVIAACAGCFFKPDPQAQSGGDARPVDVGEDSGGSGSDSGLPSVNYMFVTSTVHNFGIEQTDQPTLDAECTHLANTLGHLPGHFIAAYETGATMTVEERLGSNTSWYRPDGKPIGDTWTNMVAGNILYPISEDETGNTISDADVFTGMDANGVLSGDCASDSVGSFGKSNTATTVWLAGHGQQTCERAAHFYCMGIDYPTPLTPISIPSGTKHVWLTAAGHNGQGPSNDSLCMRSQDHKAGFVLVYDGTGIPRHPAPQANYYRDDGVFVGTDLLAPEAPITTTEDGVHPTHPSASAWFGQPGTQTGSDDSCMGWSTNVGTKKGNYIDVGDPRTIRTGMTCITTAYLTCFEP